jgi:hypothetical protein
MDTTSHAPKPHDLVGLPWWCLGRAAALQWFHFGRRRTLHTPHGPPRDVGDFALHVQAPWRVSLGGNIVLGSGDLQFPSGTSRSDEIPDDYDWNRHPTRLDEVAEVLQRDVLPRRVLSVETAILGSLTLVLEGNLSLQIFSHSSCDSEAWRILVPGDTNRDHLVELASRHAASLPGVARSLGAAARATRYTRAHASVRFMGDSLDPLDVTLALRLPYDHAHRAGEPRILRRRSDLSVREYTPFRSGMWSMSSESRLRSANLDDHVRWLLDELEARAPAVGRLLEAGAVGDIFCFSSGAPASPPALPKVTLDRVEALGLTLDIDHYGSDDDAADV